MIPNLDLTRPLNLPLPDSSLLFVGLETAFLRSDSLVQSFDLATLDVDLEQLESSTIHAPGPLTLACGHHCANAINIALDLEIGCYQVRVNAHCDTQHSQSRQDFIPDSGTLSQICSLLSLLKLSPLLKVHAEVVRVDLFNPIGNVLLFCLFI